MLTLYQRLVLGSLLLVAVVIGVSVSAHNSLAEMIAIPVAVVIAALMIFFVIKPIRETARLARNNTHNDIQQSIPWRHKDDLGIIAAEMNRLLLRNRELRDSESGRLQMERQLSEAVVHSIFEPVIVTDAKGRVLRLNQAATDLLGAASSDQMILSSTPGGEKILNAIRMAVSMRHVGDGETETALLPMRIGKAQRSYRVRATPIRGPEDNLLGAVTVLEDVTELEAVDRFKTRFLSVASQKLRDPLERLRLALYSLSRGYAGQMRPLQSDLVAGAEQEIEKMTDLMTDLIEVGELETGRRVMKIERIRPIIALRNAAARHQAEARKKKIEISIRAFEDLADIDADPRALRTILDNLLTNAIRYSPESGVVLIEATEIKDGVQFFVSDNGPGIAPERLPRIFGRFSSEADGGGSGLGLALIRRLTESLGGQVSVESRLGQGTTFSFTLPTSPLASGRHPVEMG